MHTCQKERAQLAKLVAFLLVGLSAVAGLAQAPANLAAGLTGSTAGPGTMSAKMRAALKARAKAEFADLDKQLEQLEADGRLAYQDYKPGQAIIQRGEMKLAPRVRLETRIGLYAGADTQLTRGDLVERAGDASDRGWMTGFAVPRARFGMVGQFAAKVPFAIVTDLAGSRLTDAWIGYERFRYAKMWFGARTVPFSRSAILSSADAALSERSRAVSAMAPFRQVGVTLGGDYEDIGLSWRLGAYNGFDRLGTFYEGTENAAGLHGNRLAGLSSVGRLQWEPLGKMGDAVADMERKGLRLSVGGGAWLNDGGTNGAMGVGADLHVKAHGFHLLVEHLQDKASPFKRPKGTLTIPEDVERAATVIEIGWMGRKLSVAGRAELSDPNKAVDNSDDELGLSAAVGWHFIRNMLRFDVQFDHRREQNGQPYDNDVVLAKMLLRL